MRRLVLQALFNGPVVHNKCTVLPRRDLSGACAPLQDSGRVHGGALAFFLDAVGGASSRFRIDPAVVAFAPRWNGEIYKETGTPKCSLFPLPTGRAGPAPPPCDVTQSTSTLTPPMWAFDHFRRVAFDPRT